MNNATTQKAAVTRMAGALTVGAVGLFALPVLSVLCVAFAAIGAGLPILSVLNLIGITHIPFNVLFWQINGLQQVFVAVIVGGAFLGLCRLCACGLKGFFAYSRRVTH